MPPPETLILHRLAPLHWAIAGVAIAGITLALLFFGNRRLGVSSGFEDVCSLVTHQPYFARRAVVMNRSWRLPFVVGLLIGGVLSAVLGGGWSPTWALGSLDQTVALGHAGKVAWMFGGGLLVGFGTRLGNGCTSGHGIFGLSNLEFPSLVATVTFLAAGMATTHLVHHFIR